MMRPSIVGVSRRNKSGFFSRVRLLRCIHAHFKTINGHATYPTLVDVRNPAKSVCNFVKAEQRNGFLWQMTLSFFQRVCIYPRWKGKHYNLYRWRRCTIPFRELFYAVGRLTHPDGWPLLISVVRTTLSQSVIMSSSPTCLIRLWRCELNRASTIWTHWRHRDSDLSRMWLTDLKSTETKSYRDQQHSKRTGQHHFSYQTKHRFKVSRFCYLWLISR